MKEDPQNIGGIHSDCAEARRQEFQSIHTIEDICTGDYVKKKFTCGHKSEHMWIKVLSKEGSKIIGILDNDPQWIPDIECGDRIELDFSEVEQLLKG